MPAAKSRGFCIRSRQVYRPDFGSPRGPFEPSVDVDDNFIHITIDTERIKTDEACTYFLTVLQSHPELILGQNDQDSDQATDQGGDQAVDQELKVLELCKQPHSRTVIIEALRLSNHHDNYKQYKEPLLEK